MNKFEIPYVALIFLLLLGCANPGVPTGGDKDEEAPKVTNTSPDNYSVKFNKKRIVIDFDEFVRLNDVFKNVVISPPQKKKPKIRLKERQIVIDIVDSLKKNKTYTIDFGKAIVDNNEGNPLGEYRYVFATGEQIAKMGLAGYVRGAEADSVVQGATVALYTPSDTLNPYQLMPEYVAQTDSLGFFMFNNIEDRDYRIFAFKDENKNSMLDLDEPLAFREGTVHTSIKEEVEGDSIQLDKYTKFQNTELLLYLFKPEPSQQYLKDYKRPSREQLIFTFNAPRRDSLQLDFLNSEEDPQFLLEQSEKSDTLVYWMMNPDLIVKDTLLAKLSYLRTDSLGELRMYDDTLRLTYKEPKKKRKKKEKEKEDIDFMKIETNMSGKINYFDELSLSFERPVVNFAEKDIKIFTMQDSLELSKKFILKKDSVQPYRKYNVLMELNADEKYFIRIDSMSVYDTSKRPNAELNTSFEIHRDSYYGKIFVSVLGGEDGVLIQIIDMQQSDKIIAQKRWKDDGEKLLFENLPPATYGIKAIWDTNRNGKWDSGDYKKRLQPERVRFFKKEIRLPSNWELEVSWTLKKEEDETN